MKVYLYCTKGGESLSYDREARKWVLSPKKNDDGVAGLETDTSAQVLSAKVTDGFSAPTFVSR